MMEKLFKLRKLLVLFVTVFYVQSSYAQTTYTVTSTSVGPSTTSGTFLWAVDQANTNPGADIIEFTAGLQVNAGATNVSLLNPIMALINESVTIDGKGSSLNGYQLWVTQGGITNGLENCPRKVTTQLSYMPGFVAIGTRGQDNSAIEVTIKNLTVKHFNQVAQIADNASLILDNFTGLETWATLQCAGEPMINGFVGASLTIKNSLFDNAKNWGTVPYAGSIYMGQNAGDLIIENSRFHDLTFGSQPAIYHSGVAGSKLNIVSSRFYQSGGIETFGAVETNIVNSIWTNKATLIPSVSDRIINNSSGDMNIIASSIMWNTNQCDGLCGASMDNKTSLIEIRAEGDLNFLQSAVGFNFDPSTGAPALLTLGVATGGTATKGVFTADEYTYIEPTTIQDAAALNTLVTTPPSTSLLTGVGFIRGVVPTSDIDIDFALVTPAADGQLIDAIPSGNTLINPIDGSTITLDIVGNDRADANGNRDIGALQLALAPILSVSSIGDSQVALSWNEPLHHEGLTIIKYEVVYNVSGGSSPTTVTIDPPALTQTISSLTNGTDYEFKVRAIYNATGTEENGPYSNIVKATLYGPVANPALNAYPANGEVKLTWNLPDLGGHRFSFYALRWRLKDDINVVGNKPIYDINTLEHTITGLTNGTAYDFSIVVGTYDGTHSDEISKTATPFTITNTPTVTATPGNTEVALTWDLPDLGGGVFSFYAVRWYLNGTTSPVIGNQIIRNINTLSTTVTGLINHIAYDFVVEAVANGGVSPGGLATATPFGPIAAPTVAAVPGDTEVALSWDQPDLGGAVFSSYEVKWYLKGTTTPLGNQIINDINTLNTSVTGLTNNTAYDFVVQVVAVGGTSSEGLATATPFGSIAALVVTTVPGDAEVALSWNLPDLGGAVFTDYTIEWRIGAGGVIGSQTITDANTLNTTITGLTNATAYEFSTQVNVTGGASAKGIVTATPFGPIAAPTVAAVPGDREVALSWNLPELGGAVFTDYTIEWRIGAGSVIGSQTITDASTTGTTITGLTDGTAYEFSVQVNVNGGASAKGVVTSTPFGPIAAPTVVAVPGNAVVVLSWNLPELGGGIFSSYLIEWSQVGSGDIIGVEHITNPGTLSTGITGLTNGTAYEFRLRVNADGGVSDNGVVTSTPFAPIPAPVVVAVPGDAEVALSWNLPELGGAVFTDYTIEWKIGAGSVIGSQTITDANTLNTTITGLTNATAYEFSVQVTVNGGASDKGAVSATPFGPIAAPTVAAFAGDSEVTLSWNIPELGGAAFIDYTIEWRIGTGTVIGSQTFSDAITTSATVTGLTNATAYEFSVYVNVIGGASDKGVVTATPFGPIPAPVVTAVPVGSDVALSWNLPELGGAVFTEYVVRWRTGTGNVIGSQVFTDPNTTSMTITGLSTGTYYQFSVRVYVIGGASARGSATSLGPVATTDADLSDIISYYPNPVKDRLNIVTKENFRIQLFSSTGSLLIDSKNEKIIDVSKLSGGTYLLHIEIDNKIYSGKIIKK